MLCGVIIIIVFAVVSANFVADWQENYELSGEELKKVPGGTRLCF